MWPVAQQIDSAMLVVMAVAGMLAAGEVGEMPEVGMLEVAVCTCGRHVQLTAWVDRVADAGLAEDRVAGRRDPSKIRN